MLLKLLDRTGNNYANTSGLSSSDSAAVPVLSLALFHYRSDMEGSKRQYIAVFRILSMVQTLRSVQIMAEQELAIISNPRVLNWRECT